MWQPRAGAYGLPVVRLLQRATGVECGSVTVIASGGSQVEGYRGVILKLPHWDGKPGLADCAARVFSFCINFVLPAQFHFA